MNNEVVRWGEALLEADTDRVGKVRTVRFDEALFWRQGRWRTKQWCTSVVNVGGRQLTDIVNGSTTDPLSPATATEAVRDAIAASITTLPQQLRRSLTWNQGAEMVQHAQLRIDAGLAIYFCDPQAPWQRGTNENTNGLLRQYFPKGTDLTRHTPSDLDAVAAALNSRPRKTRGWKTPTETLNEHLHSLKQGSVATTP